MEWIFYIIFLILLAYIADQISRLNNNIKDLENSSTNSDLDLSGIEYQLENLYKIMGGDEKIREIEKKRIDNVKDRLVKLLTEVDGKKREDAEKEARKHIKKAETELEDDNYSGTLQSIEAWIKKTEKEERNKKKYGSLLDKARKYVKSKEKIDKHDTEFEEELNTDYEGKSWIIDKLVKEKVLEEITEESPYSGLTNISHWRVIK